jgi:hypothetical protein
VQLEVYVELLCGYLQGIIQRVNVSGAVEYDAHEEAASIDIVELLRLQDIGVLIE